MAKNKPFSARLRELITASGRPVAEIAERAGVTRQTIYQLLRTDHDPGWSTVQRLADALGKSTEDFR